MGLKSISLGTALFATLAVPLIAVEAHGIWFASRAKQIAIIYGVGADDLESVKRLPMMQNITGYDADYHPIKATPRVAGPLVLVDTDSQPTLVAAEMPYGIWSRTDDGEFEKKTLEEMPNATVSTKNVKYALAILGPLSKPIPALPNQALQIVPDGPIPEKLGMPLRYKVLYQGKPQAGVRMINDMVNDPDAKEQETGPDGTLTMPVRNQGLNIIRAVYVSSSDQPKLYKQIEHTATLAFTLSHLPE
jgi:nickel transport protein